MRTLRWTKEVTQDSQRYKIENGKRIALKEKVIQIHYDNDEEKMLADGWTQDGFYDDDGNVISCKDAETPVFENWSKSRPQ